MLKRFMQLTLSSYVDSLWSHMQVWRYDNIDKSSFLSIGLEDADICGKLPTGGGHLVWLVLFISTLAILTSHS